MSRLLYMRVFLLLSICMFVVAGCASMKSTKQSADACPRDLSEKAFREDESRSRVRVDGAFVFGEIGSSEYRQQVQGARVDLLTADRVTADSAITDAHGQFLIGPGAPGSYDLLVRALAHQRAFLKVTLQAAATDTVRIVLKHDTSGMIADCIGPDGWSFGSQYCKD